MEDRYIDPEYLLIPALVILAFLLYIQFFPTVINQDEFLLMHDGTAVRNYMVEAAHGNLQHPLQFLVEYQKHTIGLLINVYPPFVSAVFAIGFMVFGESYLLARMIHLVFMILFLVLFYHMLQRSYTRAVARIGTALLIINFTFMKYFAILYREITYVFFIFLSIYLLQRWFETRDRRYACGFLLSLIAGSMCKDFFLLCLPALGFLFLQRCRFRWNRTRGALRRFFDWKTALLSAVFLIASFSYYLLKYNTSPKEEFILFGGFLPVLSFWTYVRSLFLDNPVLFIAGSLAMLLFAYKAWRRRLDRGDKETIVYLVLLGTFILFMISVHLQILRYAYLFYPVSAVLVAKMLHDLRKRRILAVLLGGIIVTGIIAASLWNFHEQRQFYANGLEPEVTDEAAIVQYLAENRIEGNVLLLSGYRFDLSYYFRHYNHNLDHYLINSYFEKGSAHGLAWSRFGAFYQELPQCEYFFTDSCWDSFVDHSEVKVIIVDKWLLSDAQEGFGFDPAIAGYARTVSEKNTPVFETGRSAIYLVKE
jgi:hypothetical protein